jgi:hypothetical protein
MGAPANLGISGKSIHAQAGEDGRYARLAARQVRFDLLKTAQRLLHSPTASAADQHATVWCHRTSHSSEGNVQVFRANSGMSARLGGVVTCGAVWSCPVCCAKIAEERRHELSHAMAEHVDRGGFAYLLTFTFPHDKTDRLADLMAKLDKARQKFQNSRLWKGWKETSGRVGGVTSLEVTYGHNGWHPHLHMLVFTNPKAFGEGKPMNDFGDLSSMLIQQLHCLWVDCLQKVGLCDNSKVTDAMQHAFNVRGGERAAEYIAKFGRDEKWGQSSELTRQHAKVGKLKLGKTWHVTPFQILDLIREGETEFIPAFREYVEAFTGKRMLTWTPGLKKLLGIGDLSDEQLAAEGVAPQVEETRVASLSYEQFVQVTACGKVGALLYFVGRYGGAEHAQHQVDAWIDIECRLPDGFGDVRRKMFGMNKFTTVPPT